MTPDLIKRADMRIEELRAELDERRAELEDLESFVVLYQRISQRLGGEAVAKETAAKIEQALNRPTPQREIHDIVRAILHHEGRAMPTNLLFERLTKKGVIVGGQNPVGNLGAKLAYAIDLENIKGIGWWFKPEKDEAQRSE